MDNTDSSTNTFLAGLNEAQRQAVLLTEGPLLVLAGAGTGKTKALTSRITYLLTQKLAMPGQILAVTFTNKAAREMEHRIHQLIGDYTSGLWLGTFHSIAVRILRRHADLLGYSHQFTIIDTDDQERLMRQVLQELFPNLDDKKYSGKSILQVIQRFKDKGLLPEDLVNEDRLLGKGHWDPIDVYTRYQERLKQLNAMDFGDLLLLNLKLFKEFPQILRDYQHQFKYILVDEYQDTNVTQYLWLRLFAQHHKNICCVGDDDQSIYGWRGAEVGNILKFEHEFPGAKIIRLEDNYRSTPHILAAASGLIKNNNARLGKTLRTTLAEGEKVHVIKVWDDQQEAYLVGNTMLDLFKEGFKPYQCAVLVRAGSQTRSFEDQFTRLGIAYRVIGGFKFYERLEVRDVIAYLRLLIQPSDDLAFERIINTPKRGVGDSTP
ncbi:MAG: UvrD-helicase domain-containing protein [Alphaproteobacteria bacterium]|nr:UvrD-helicase domain-containing protein [Alphaproteobacteria bacterium]